MHTARLTSDTSSEDSQHDLSRLLSMLLEHFNLLLADDDKDDCLFFRDALEELPVQAELTTVHNGEQLMQLLGESKDTLPHVLFLDLNMPRKNGFECLSELKLDDRLKSLPVIIFSTSFEQDVVNLLYKKGGQYYIRKPAEFSQLKNVILEALTLIAEGKTSQPDRDQFVITGRNPLAT